MRPVQVTVDVPQSRDVVYDFLDVLANHELFTDHMLRDWQCDGPERGVGAKARVNAVVAGRADPLEMEVVEAEPPRRTVERNVSLGGRRVLTGTYTLEEIPAGGTRITFESAWEKAPRSEQWAAPLVRMMVRRSNGRSIERLAAHLQTLGRGET